MKSKEALKWLYVYLTCDYCPMNSKCDDNNKWKCVECKEIIEKDLDKLEKFAHENASLHTKLQSLHTKNEKLKKVIEILKDYLMIKVSINRNNEYCLDACDYAIPHLNKEQYDLLKEYL